ncbi:hypothetical protein KM043_005661 [Ampulex compressa]|nr:hypothetical protein KM043_005661 [Ampulex compressa]
MISIRVQPLHTIQAREEPAILTSPPSGRGPLVFEKRSLKPWRLTGRLKMAPMCLPARERAESYFPPPSRQICLLPEVETRDDTPRFPYRPGMYSCGSLTPRAEEVQADSYSCATLVLVVAASAVGLGRVQLPRQRNDEEADEEADRTSRGRKRDGDSSTAESTPGFEPRMDLTTRLSVPLALAPAKAPCLRACAFHDRFPESAAVQGVSEMVAGSFDSRV